MHIKVDRCSVKELQFEDSVIAAVCNIQPPTGINRHTVRTISNTSFGKIPDASNAPSTSADSLCC